MFKIFRIRSYYLILLRGIYIAYTLLSFFMINWMSRGRYLRVFVPKKYKRNGGILAMPERLRLIIEELGPTFIKFGQILADRPDIVSERLRLELKKLQSDTEPIDHDVAMRLIEEELGTPVDKYFSEIDRAKCIGSASIGQVYKGKLATGEEVVIKIQRPDIESKIRLDLQLLKYFAQQLVLEYPGLTVVDIVGFVDEFGETLMMELNYVNEAANIVRFGEIFKDVPYCKIPKVHTEISTSKLLIMEYVEGVNPDNVYHLIKEGYDPKVIAENGTNVLLQMIFKHGFFHADPHPGNLFVQRDNGIALIDFGMVGSLKPSHMQFLAGFTLGLATNKPRVITEALLTLCNKKFFAEKDDLEFYVQDMLNRHGSLSYDKMNFSQILNESIKIILRFQLRIPASIYLLLKALATIEKFGAKLHPQISLPAIIRPYATELIRKKYAPATIANNLFDAIGDYISLVRDFPSEVNEILYKMKQGKLIHEIHLSDQQIWSRSAKSVANAVAIAFLIGFLMVSSLLMSFWGKTPWIGNLMFGISSVMALWLVLRLFSKTRF